MKKSLLVSLAVALTPALASAQVAGSKCETKDAVGYIGISGIDCDCTISSPKSGKPWSFRSEPVITSLEMDSRGGKVLKIGDVITHVNGKPVRTREGAQELADIEPGQAVVLTVRRNGEELKYAITAESVCPSDTRLLGIWAPAAVPRTAPRAYTVTPVPTPARPKEAPAAPRAMPVIAYPRATFGMGLSCSGSCSINIKQNEKDETTVMSFSQAPEVYSIEAGGPADKAGIRRGDVLTHINSKAMDSDEGGALFANVKPGQTVRFTVKRGEGKRDISVKAVERVPVGRAENAHALAQSYRSVTEAREAARALERQQNEQVRKLTEEMRKAHSAQEADLRAAYSRILKAEEDHKRQLKALSSHLSVADARVKAALADSTRLCAVPVTAPSAATRASRTLRYTGSLADTEIEVRGGNPVSVNETKDEVVITTGATVVRISKKK